MGRSRGRRIAVVVIAGGMFVAGASLVAVIVGGGSGPGDREVTAFSARDPRGAVVGVEALRGRPALLTSWATWCRECRTLLPALEEFHDRQGDTGIRVVAVNVNAPGTERSVGAFERDYGMSMDRWRDTDNDFTRVFGARGVPTSVLIDAGGAVVRRWAGGVPLEDREVRRMLADLARSSA